MSNSKTHIQPQSVNQNLFYPSQHQNQSGLQNQFNWRQAMSQQEQVAGNIFNT